MAKLNYEREDIVPALLGKKATPEDSALLESIFEETCVLANMRDWSARMVTDKGDVIVYKYSNAHDGNMYVQQHAIGREFLLRELASRKTRKKMRPKPVMGLNAFDRTVINLLTDSRSTSARANVLFDDYTGSVTIEVPSDRFPGDTEMTTYRFPREHIEKAEQALRGTGANPPTLKEVAASAPHFVLHEDGSVTQNVDMKTNSTANPPRGTVYQPARVAAVTLDELMEQIALHKRDYESGGDGYVEPRWSTLNCSECDEVIWAYDESAGEPDDPEDAWDRHIAEITAITMQVRFKDQKATIPPVSLSVTDEGPNLAAVQRAIAQGSMFGRGGMFGQGMGASGMLPGDAYVRMGMGIPAAAVQGGPTYVKIGDSWTELQKAFMDGFKPVVEAFGKIAKAMDIETPPTDPRARALWLKEHRNTGPQRENFTKRGKG